MRVVALALGLVMLASPVAGHELQIYTVIVNTDGAQPAEIPNGTLKEGDSAWFWMKDTTDNATLVVEIEKDGAKARSPVLQFECELDENGSKVNEECTNRYDFVFSQQSSAGLWNFTFLTYVNDTLTKTSSGSAFIQEDLHDEMHNETPVEEVESSSSEDEDKKIPLKAIAGIVAILSFIGIAVILTSEAKSLEKE